MQLGRFAVLAFAALLAAPAWADSDGYYCIGPDYLAYQFGLAAPPVAPYRLYVVRLDGVRGLSEPAAIEIPQFQVHGMHCGEETVQLESFSALYTVHLDSLRRPVWHETAGSEDGQRRTIMWGVDRRLGGYGFATKELAPERRTLMRDASGHEFIIEIEPKLSGSNRCEAEITTRLVELDASRKIVREQVLYKGLGYLVSASCVNPD